MQSKTTFIIIVILVLIGGGLILTSGAKIKQAEPTVVATDVTETTSSTQENSETAVEEDATTPIVPPALPDAVLTGSSTSVKKYKDGSYRVVGDYNSPGGAEQIGVMIVLQNGMIVDSTVTLMATRPISVKKQEEFIAGYKQFVTGKSIDEVTLTKVSGSSLTPIGFNDALAKVKLEAQG